MLSFRGLLKGVDAVVLRNDESHMDENVFYLLEEKPSTATMFLILKKNSIPVLFVSELELGNYTHKKHVRVEKLDKESLAKELGNIKGKIGLNFETQTANQLKRLKKFIKAQQVDISSYFEKAREVKTQAEIKKIKTACRITAEIFDRVQDLMKICRTEKNLALKLEFEARNNGADAAAFPPIIASGISSAIPHYATADKKISEGFLVVDFGVVYDGYCSDITRTFFVGMPNAYHKHMFAAVYNAKEAATKMCFAGTEARKVHNAADSVLEKNFGEKMIHAVGHGLGLKVHDFPQGINANAPFTLKENMCITVEPGYYKRNFGGVRIEDDVIIKKGKCRELTKAEKVLFSLKI
ncbi:MAG: aminopeptidase P family protein [Candidatus Aenigmarchaeota archaeon]|nr:aminopeptidase P family protein [Candidatus Aenigmarchaeota archaeon]